MITIDSVTKRYGDKHGIYNISLTIPKGQVTSFVGPNGAGKSTLMSVISRLQTVDEGTVLVDGIDVQREDSRTLARKIAILKQFNAINVRLTVEDLVAFGRFPHSGGRLDKTDRQHIDEALDYMGLDGVRATYLDQLSGGQSQRAFIAMILAQNTDYVLLDEPLNNLDMKHSAQMMKVLRRLVDDKGKTVVLVLHDINFAAAYSDYIVALKDGAVAREGSAERMIDSGVLRDIFDMDIPVHCVNDQKVCLYFK